MSAAAEQLARLRAMPHHGLAPITLGTNYDLSSLHHVQVLEALQDEGWTVQWHQRTYPADATRDCPQWPHCPTPETAVRRDKYAPAWEGEPTSRTHGHPHPFAGQTVPWGKATPPDYDRTRDPVAAATNAAIQATGNSDGAGRGGERYAGVAAAASSNHRDLRVARARSEALAHPYGREWDQ